MCGRPGDCTQSSDRYADMSDLLQLSAPWWHFLLRAVVIYTPTPIPTAPCGACRQVISEFGPQAAVISICNSAQRIATTLPALLGEAFGRENLIKGARPRSGRKARGSR